MAELAWVGYRAEMTDPHWLAKVFCGESFIDVIFCSGNGINSVDEDWFAYAVAEEVFGIPVQLCSPEEIIWPKAFVMERERFDGAGINYLIRAWRDRLQKDIDS